MIQHKRTTELQHRLIGLRSDLQMSQREFAPLLGLTQSALSSYERGVEPRITVIRLVTALEMLAMGRSIKEYIQHVEKS